MTDYTITIAGVGAQGASGADGATLNFQGSWALGRAFATDDLVSEGGSSYACILGHTSTADDRPGTGVNASTYWTIFVEKGEQGIQGIQGEQGIQGIQGETGPGFTGGSHNPSTGVVTFTSEDGIGFSTGDLTGDTGATGDKGWSPVLVIATDGERRVFQVDDWSGGEGTKPAVGDYVGASGLVSDIASAIDVRGATGATGDQGIQGEQGIQGLTGDTGPEGDDGWSPVFSIVTDGARRVLQVADWVGGEGTKPATGQYVGPTGLVTPVASAVDIRGPQGAAGASGSGTGDMLAANYDPQNINDDAFDRANHTGAQAISTVTGLQTALDGKAASSHNHAASEVTSGTFADARISETSVTQHEAALTLTESQISDLGAYLTIVSVGDLSDWPAAVSVTEVGYLDGVTSAIQTQIDGKQAVLSEGAFANGDKTKLDGIETGATADQTGSEIKTALFAESDTNNLTDSLLSKLNGIEAGADVTDTANVTAAGALMDSEVANLADVKSFDPEDYATAAQGTTANNALARAGGDMTGTLGVRDVDEGTSALSGTTPSLSCTAATVFTLTTSGNTTVSVTNEPSGRSWQRMLHVTFGGAHTLDITGTTYAGAKWGDADAPTFVNGGFYKIAIDGVGGEWTLSLLFEDTP